MMTDTPPDTDDTGLQAEESDPLEPFNSAMFTFNLKVDDYVLHPVASGYAKVIPQGGREAIGRALDNVRVIPRFANNAFQLRLPQAGSEVARFGINTTVGLLGLFDPADHWFGLKEHPDDFGLTLRYYHAPTGPYLMLPFFGPSTISDTVGRVADGFMDPLSYFVPWYISLAAGGGESHRGGGELSLAASRYVRGSGSLRGRFVWRGAGCLLAVARQSSEGTQGRRRLADHCEMWWHRL